jgi:hypothetical protein
MATTSLSITPQFGNNTVTSKEFNACAYTQKVVKFGKMMKARGHEASWPNPPCMYEEAIQEALSFLAE